MALPLTFRHVCLDASNSNETGAPMFVGDLRQLSLSIESQTNAASRYSLIGTNADGFRTALGTPSQTVMAGEWSHITQLVSQGLFTFDPGALGYRWVNLFRPSASSVTATFNGRT